jgi:hypothetical protein
MENRRQFTRLTQPLDGRYRGQSGALVCRIMDISWGGCFIETLSTPSRDERTTVTVPIGDTKIEIDGCVVYVDRGMGFAVRFDPLTRANAEALKELLGDPPPAEGAEAKGD